MGNCCSCCCCCKKDIKRREIVLACLGLDGSGKTTALKIIKGENARDVLSTNGFSVINMTFNREFTIKVYDVGGGERIRDIWSNYYAEVHGLVYVMNASTESRIEEDISVLYNVLGQRDIRGKPILILLNRLNPDSFDEFQFTNKARLHSTAVTNRQHFFIAHMDEYAQLPKSRGSSRWVATRARKYPSSHMDGFQLMIRKVIENYVTLSEGVQAAEERLKKRQQEERDKRRLRLAEIEQRKKMEEEEEKAKAASEPQPGPSNVVRESPNGRLASIDEAPIDLFPDPVSISPDGTLNGNELAEIEEADRRTSKVSSEVFEVDRNASQIGRKSGQSSILKTSIGLPNAVEKFDSSLESSISEPLDVFEVPRQLPTLPPLVRNSGSVDSRVDSISATSRTSKTSSGPVPIEAFVEENPRRRKTRMERIKSGLAKRRAAVNSVDAPPVRRHETTTAHFFDSRLPHYRKEPEADISDLGDTVSAKNRMRPGSNTSLKSYPNGDIANYSKSNDEVTFSENRHETTTVNYFDSKIPSYKMESMGLQNPAFQPEQPL